MNNRSYRNFARQGYVPLREYMEAQIIALKESIIQAKADMERRMDGFPDQFIKKGETDNKITEMKSDLKTLTTFRDRMEGKASQQSFLITLAIAVLGLIASILSLLLKIADK